VSESVENCVVNSTACSYSIRPTKIVTRAPVLLYIALILASTHYLITRSPNSLTSYNTTPHSVNPFPQPYLSAVRHYLHFIFDF
jgi:hypothetical protein